MADTNNLERSFAYSGVHGKVDWFFYDVRQYFGNDFPRRDQILSVYYYCMIFPHGGGGGVGKRGGASFLLFYDGSVSLMTYKGASSGYSEILSAASYGINR